MMRVIAALWKWKRGQLRRRRKKGYRKHNLTHLDDDGLGEDSDRMLEGVQGKVLITSR